MLTTREVASLLWLGVFGLILVVWAVRDRSLRSSITDMMRIAWPRIVLLVLIFYAYVGLWVWLAARLGAWSTALIPQTVFWGVASGTALIFSATRAHDPAYFARALRNIFALTVVVEVTFEIASFWLWVEVLLQAVVMLLLLTQLVARGDEKLAPVPGCTDVLLAIFGVALIGSTFLLIWHDRSTINWSQQTLTLAMLVWLPLVSLPFVYVAAWAMNYNRLVRHVRARQRGRPARLSTRAAIIVGFNVGLRDLGRAGWRPANALAEAPTFRAALSIIREFRAPSAPAPGGKPAEDITPGPPSGLSSPSGL